MKRLGLGGQILVALALGALAGAVLGERATVLQPAGDLFIRLLVLAAVPLVFFNLTAGLTALTDLGALGRLTVRLFVYFAATTVVAVLLAMGAMTALQPGVGMTLRAAVTQEVVEPPSVLRVILDLIPTNAVRAFADGNVAQVVVLAVMLGVATLLLPEERRERLRVAFGDIAALMRKVVDLILVIAPYGVAALMAATVGRYGAELFGPLARFVLGVNAAHLLMVAVYLVVLALVSRLAPGAFLKDTGAIWATTIATTSSMATLPVALETAERMRLPRSVYAFTLPFGVQVNKNGTVILLTSVVLFTAQATGVAIGAADVFKLVVLSFLLSAGTGGIPGGGLVVALVMVEAFNLPLELAAIIGGIYRLVDMGNTTVNVMGNMVGTVLMTDWERGRRSVEPAPERVAA